MDNHFEQLVVWTGTTLGDSDSEAFEDFFKEEGFRIKFAKQFMTLPDPGKDPSESGGRSDILFYIHNHDIPKFSVWRLQHGMRWWEDYLDNGSDKIVPVEILNEYKYGWDKETDPDNGRPKEEYYGA